MRDNGRRVIIARDTGTARIVHIYTLDPAPPIDLLFHPPSSFPTTASLIPSIISLPPPILHHDCKCLGSSSPTAFAHKRKDSPWLCAFDYALSAPVPRTPPASALAALNARGELWPANPHYKGRITYPSSHVYHGVTFTPQKPQGPSSGEDQRRRPRHQGVHMQPMHLRLGVSSALQ